MNNVVQKNIVYGVNNSNTLPYGKKNSVSLMSDQIICMSLNDQMRKMLDNDLYIERNIINDSNYPMGPDKIIDNVVESSPNGSNFWYGMDYGSNDISILQKRTNTFGNSIVKTDISSEVNFISYNMNYMIGTSDGLKYANNLSNYEALSDVLSNEIYGHDFSMDGKNLFIVSDGGIYRRIGTRIDGRPNLSTISPLSARVISRFNRDRYDNDRFIIAGDLGLSSFTFKNDKISQISEIGLSSEHVMDFEFNDSIDTVAYFSTISSDVSLSSSFLYEIKMDKYGNINTSRVNEIRDNQVNSMRLVDSNYLLIGTDKGLFYRSDDEIKPIEEITDRINYITYDDLSTDEYGNRLYKYWIATDRKIYLFQVYRKEPVQYTITLVSDLTYNAFMRDNEIKRIDASDSNNIFILTKKGLFIKKITYTCDDVLKTIFNTDIDHEIVESYKREISSHIQQYHDGSSLITKINKDVINVDFEGISEDWLKNNSIVRDISYDDQHKYIKAKYKNQQTFNTTTGEREYKDLPTPKYILKSWTNGSKELYVFLPTTNTYYIPHTSNCPYCRFSNVSLKHINTDTSSIGGDIDSNATDIKLLIDTVSLSIDNIIQIDANGNSLPLKIYKDSENDCYGTQNLFHSTIMPTVMTEPIRDLVPDQDGYCEFNLRCFGTDAQAIRITGYQNLPNEEAQIFRNYTVRYHMLSSIREEQYILNKNYDTPTTDEVRSGCMFSGWSYVDGSASPDISVGKQFINLTNENNTVDMYPVYSDYNFNGNKTILQINADDKPFYVDGSFANGFSDVVIDYDSIVETNLEIQPTTDQTMWISSVGISGGEQVVIDWDE